MMRKFLVAAAAAGALMLGGTTLSNAQSDLGVRSGMTPSQRPANAPDAMQIRNQNVVIRNRDGRSWNGGWHARNVDPFGVPFAAAAGAGLAAGAIVGGTAAAVTGYPYDPVIGYPHDPYEPYGSYAFVPGSAGPHMPHTRSGQPIYNSFGEQIQ